MNTSRQRFFPLNKSTSKFFNSTPLGSSASTPKLNCSNTLSKFYKPAEEHIKKLEFFDPKKEADSNLYNLKIIKSDAKKLEEKKNLATLRDRNLLLLISFIN